jgi:sarcosine oxidase
LEAVVVGAGTFGASLAWRLARAGARVTLVDQFEPGDRRASSGGETRLYRCAHGDAADYTAMARRAGELWRELEDESGEELLVRCGLVWFAHRADGWEAASERTLGAHGIPCERLSVERGAELFPSFAGDDLAFVLFEPEAGVLRAQRAVRALAARAVAEGARLIRGRARPDGAAAVLEDGTRLTGDVVVWACGAWLSALFADVISLNVTCQELHFLDGGPAWRAPGVPGWCDYDGACYGTADLDALGVKVAIDAEGPPLAPDAELPAVARTEAEVRAYARRRFPALADAPLNEVRTCRYEITPDTHFLAGPHPAHDGVWLVGGGSGHGFKHGPAMAERLIAAIAGRTPLPAHFALVERAPSRSMRTAGSGSPH